METILCSLEETHKCAANLVKELSAAQSTRTSATVVGLSGELGAGKTTFVQAAARALGVALTVTSPTFVIEKIYKLDGGPFKHLIHIDAYRLTDENELRMLGWDDIAYDPKNIIFIEWPENVKELLPRDTTLINLEVAGEYERHITLKSKLKHQKSKLQIKNQNRHRQTHPDLLEF